MTELRFGASTGLRCCAAQETPRRRIFPDEPTKGPTVKKSLLVVVALISALVLAGTASTKAWTVSITKNGFSPTSLSVAAGDTVTWKNDDTVSRTIVSADAGFTTQTLAPGASFAFTFAKAGKFRVEDPNAKKRTQMFVTVAAAPLTVTLATAKPLVVYGNGVTLTGTVSTLQANEQVAILAKPCGATAAAKLVTVATVAGGTYTTVVKPLKNTLYSAQVKTATSAGATVLAKPRLTLTKPARGRFALVVRGAISFSGRAVVLQRWNATLRRWVTVKSALLVKGPAATAPTILSKASFRATVKPRTRLRASISQFQAGSCYRPGLSNVVLG
jgi:plastocyanin